MNYCALLHLILITRRRTENSDSVATEDEEFLRDEDDVTPR